MLSELRSAFVIAATPPVISRPPAAMNVARIPPPRSIALAVAPPGFGVTRSAPALPTAAT